MRAIQLALAVLGMVLVLRYGVVRNPPWGEPNGLPVHWNVHVPALSIGSICIGLALGLIWAKDRA
jgi:hypothetical protein